MGDQRDWVGVELEDEVPGGGSGHLQVGPGHLDYFIVGTRLLFKQIH